MKEFQCEICEKNFDTKNKLRRHHNYVHNNTLKVFNCNVCTKFFPVQNILSAHIKTVHGESVTTVNLVVNHYLLHNA